MTETYLLTIKDFEERFAIARSNVNNRLSGLKSKGYEMDAQKHEGRNVYSGAQVQLMDELDTHLKAGGTIATFPAADGSSEMSYVSQDKPEMSRRTQDIKPVETAPAAFGIASMIDAIAGKVADILSVRQAEQPQLPAPTAAPDPLANLKALQEACDRGWLLSTSQLSPLVGLKTLHGKEFERYGFKFTKAGKNGAEAAWRVEK